MNIKAIRPKDVLPDGQEGTFLNGVWVRKGTVAAVLQNAEVLDSPLSSPEVKEEALNIIGELIPGLLALGVHKYVTWKNPLIQNMVEEAAKKMS